MLIMCVYSAVCTYIRMSVCSVHVRMCACVCVHAFMVYVAI